ncbi:MULTISPECIES: hypothetical protein [unclassified Leifsonia]|uniref:hypothetical protein n=1 Tax=unclassified Leifsonia TaxID=2663824 RepID=UPI0012FAE174|nr:MULTISPECIES: hypothetical protein [unclassified Leifsonia]
MMTQASSTVCAAAAGALADGSGGVLAPSVASGVAVELGVADGFGVADRDDAGDDVGSGDPEHPVSTSAPDTTTTAMTLR